MRNLLKRTQGIKVELHTEKNKMPASLSRDEARTEASRSIVTGSVEIYYRSGWRLLEVRVPGQDDLLFQIGLPASPRRSTDFGRWERAQFVAAPGLAQPRKATADEPFEIRYRVIWAE